MYTNKDMENVSSDLNNASKSFRSEKLVYENF